ncbi:hypothetical protein V6N12_057026 [Hibiscus sabdariffa]|uniref:Uncharacterized protein n=1 Tax=Hibiscus sabdariffa TaxID=183260 RepID=A0ABR2DCT3_9ROSI
MDLAHFEHPGDNILAMGFVRDEAQIEEEVGDFEVGDGELYGSEGKGVANISPGQKEKEIPNSRATIRKGHKTPNLVTLKEKALASSYQNFLMDLGVCLCNLDYMYASNWKSMVLKLQAQEELLACFVLEAYVDFGYGQIWRLIAYCGVARSRKELEVR